MTRMYSSSHIKLPSVCIPRVFRTVTRKDIIAAFETVLGKGCIERVDIVPTRNNMGSYQRVFVHFKHVVENTSSKIIKNRLDNNQDVKLVYDAPWFWRFTTSRVPKPSY